MLTILKPFLGPLIEIINKVIPDKDERERMVNELNQAAIEADAKFAEAQAQVVTAEAQGNWLQASWRPILMYFLMLTVAWHMFFLPFIAYSAGVEIGTMVGLAVVPEPVWTLLIVGMGGYIGGRTLEKVWGKS